MCDRSVNYIMCQIFCSSLVKNLNEPTQLLPQELKFDGPGGGGKKYLKNGSTSVTYV